jgi:hypothetical protein
MIPLIALPTVTLLCILCPVVSAAQDDAQDVRAAVLDYIAAVNSGDVEGQQYHRLSEYSAFMGDGGLLVEGLDDKFMQALVDAGFKLSLQVRHLKVNLYGSASVVTAYLVGMVLIMYRFHSTFFVACVPARKEDTHG